MKTREEVEALKRDWAKDPCWNIEETEGFEEYRDELFDFSENLKIIAGVKWDKEEKLLQKNALVSMMLANDQNSYTQYDGLTKRELFAAMAMQGIIGQLGKHDAITVALYAIQHADALINELNKEQ